MNKSNYLPEKQFQQLDLIMSADNYELLSEHKAGDNLFLVWNILHTAQTKITRVIILNNGHYQLSGIYKIEKP